MSTVTVQQAQEDLPRLIASLQPGESVQIMDKERPVARLIAETKPKAKKRQPGSAKGQLVIVSDDDEHLKDFVEYMP